MPRETRYENTADRLPESAQQMRSWVPRHSPDENKLQSKRHRLSDHNDNRSHFISEGRVDRKQRMSSIRSSDTVKSNTTDDLKTADDVTVVKDHRHHHAQPLGNPSRVKSAQRLNRSASSQTSSTVAAQTISETPSSSTVEPGLVKRTKLLKSLLVVAGVVAGAIALVLAAKWLRNVEPVQDFLTTYSGHSDLTDTVQLGIPSWVGWQHAFNVFLLVLIVRSGLLIRWERKPAGYWKPSANSFFSPTTSTPKKVSLSQFVHQALDVLWMANGLVFIVLLFMTGHWKRIVPLDWDIFPNMASAALQYLSLDWPTENGWVHYNALQLMAYFVTVFIAAPLAVLSGIRISTWWPDKKQRLNKIYPIKVARAIHFPVMLYFAAFTVIHLFLV